jgi:hypothetical protein
MRSSMVVSKKVVLSTTYSSIPAAVVEEQMS